MLSSECPNCGASLVFRHAASVSAVCASCQSTVVREGLDTLVVTGKMSAFSRDLSAIQVGATGLVAGRGFSVAGVLRRTRPGVRWNEWYLVFDDGGEGWLAEGNGVFQLFSAPTAGVVVPAPTSLRPNQDVTIGDTTWHVIEVAHAAVSAAEGELPFAVVQDEQRPYADLRTWDGRQTGTIDGADDPPSFWPGRIVSLESLKMQGLRAFAGWSDPMLVAMQAPEVLTRRSLDCPNCGGAIPLRAPGSTVRLTCAYCGSDLDIEEVGDASTAKLLRAHSGRHWEPRLPLGKKGRLDGIDWEIIGAMKRSVEVDGIEYPWVEYFLYNPYRGSRFLVEDQLGHWLFVERTPDVPVRVGQTSPRRYRYGRGVFRHFQSGRAKVRAVLGEFDWQIKVGDSAETHDFVAPPQMLSQEVDGVESSWSLGEYIDAEVVSTAFGTKTLTPSGVAAAQVNPYDQRSVWGAALAAAMLLFVGAIGVAALEVVLARNQTLVSTSVVSTGGTADVFVTDPFTVDNAMRRHLEVSTRTSLERSVAMVHVALINTETGDAYTPVDTYRSNTASGMLYSPVPGKYVARVEVARPYSTAAHDEVGLKVVLDPPNNFPCFVFFYPFLIPLAVGLARASFEAKRWAESDYAG